MSTRFKGFALLAILVCSIGIAPVFASSPALLNSTSANPTSVTSGNTGEVTVTTDKASYNDGDKVTISGSTQDYISGTPITVRIISPIGNLVKVDQVDLGSDRTFSTSITATGVLWQEAGAYTVKVQFGSAARTAQTTFQFSGSSGGQGGNTIKVDGTDLSVKYSITNGKVLGIKADIQSKSLIVSIQTTGDGVLTITLPRALINATLPSTGQDDKYYVLVDGQEADFQETSTTTTDRTLSIPFTDGTEEIEIIGTQIVPEFGPIAALVLAIAIISIIAVSAKTGLRFMPKY
jgi:predicted secreted protein with PEFG-CTERM motif